MVNSGELSGEQRRMVFDSVGFSFVNRLLVTGELPIVPPGRLNVTIRLVLHLVVPRVC